MNVATYGQYKGSDKIQGMKYVTHKYFNDQSIYNPG